MLIGPHPAGADQSHPQLATLFDSLQQTTDPREARLVETRIWQLWLSADIPYVNELLTDGIQQMRRGEHDAALATFGTVIALDPDFAEGWNRRATVHYIMGNYEASVADIHQVLRLEPRHFGALTGLGLIYKALEESDAAIRAFEAALEHNPHIASAKRFIADLRRADRENNI